MDATSISTGTVIDRYTVDAPIGEGGMAMVFRVTHNQLGTVHALKVLTLGGRQIADRLRQEGRVQATLQHPNVVNVTDMIDLHGSPGLIMQYIEGPSLDEYLRATRLTVEQADELARGILGGVAAAHQRGLIHRDLKPANIMLHITDRGLVPKITDFGLAKVLGGSGGGFSKTRTGSTMGTPHYMSPEQVRDSKNVGPSTDIFACGAILYELVTSRRAFDGDDLLQIFNAVANGDYTRPGELVPNLPERMEQAIVGALEVEPADRPETADDLLDLWLGDGATPRPHRRSRGSAFDADSLERARSFGSSAASSGSFSSQPSEETWAPDGKDGAPMSSLPGPTTPNPTVAPPLLDRSMERPAATSSSDLRSTGSLAVFGGMGLLATMLLVGTAVVLLVGLGAAAWVMRTSPEPVQGTATTIERTPPSPTMAAPASGDDIAMNPKPAAERTDDDTVGSVADRLTAPPERPVSTPSPAARKTEEATTIPEEPLTVSDPPPAPEPDEPEPSEAQAEPEETEAPEEEATTAATSDAGEVEDPEPEPAAEPEPSGPELTPMLASNDADERRQGIDNLMTRNEDEAVRLHVHMVTTDPDSTVRQYALDTLVQRMDDANGDYWIMLEGVLFALQKGGERDALVAARALGRNAQNPDTVQAGLEHWSAKVRRESVDAAYAMKNKAPLDYDWEALLQPVTQDSDRGVSRKAQQALSDLR